MSYRKIYLADDDHDDWFIIEDSMKEIGCKEAIQFFSDGLKLIEALETNERDLPNLIILDLNMPKTNGTDTLHHIKTDERFKNIPVIIYSTSINSLEKKKCLELGAYDYVTKPVSSKDSASVARLFASFLGS